MLRFETRFQATTSDPYIRQRAIHFWLNRGVSFKDTSGEVLEGKRGSLWGNLVSFDMSKLRSKLTLSFREPQAIACQLEVDTFAQVITDYNLAWWALELETFESAILRDDEQEERWKRFLAMHKRAAWSWFLTATRKGTKLPPEEKP